MSPIEDRLAQLQQSKIQIMEHYLTDFEIALMIISGAAFFFGVANVLMVLTIKYKEDLA